MAAPEQYCKFNYFGHCKFAEKCRKEHLKVTCSHFPCNLKSCMKRHPRLCRSFSKNGSCRFDISCSFHHRPGKCEEILEEIKVLKTEIEDIKAQNELLKNMLQTFNSFQSEIKNMKDMLNDIIIKIS